MEIVNVTAGVNVWQHCRLCCQFMVLLYKLDAFLVLQNTMGHFGVVAAYLSSPYWCVFVCICVCACVRVCARALFRARLSSLTSCYLLSIRNKCFPCRRLSGQKVQ